MIFDEKRICPIGRFAALHGINKKTLMWYDEIGLLKPEFTAPNGYRYYTLRQSHRLEIILMLRRLDFSTKEIQSFFDRRDPKAGQVLLQEKICATRQKIQRLDSIAKILSKKQEELSALNTLEEGKIYLIEKKNPPKVKIHPLSGDDFSRQINRFLKNTGDFLQAGFHDTSFGSLIDTKRLYRGDFDSYCGLYMELLFDEQAENLHTPPSGLYIRTISIGSWDKLSDRYHRILDFARENNLALTGYSYEKGLNEFMVTSMDQYATQIDIPVKRLQK